jgi:hypothetical protein
MGQGDDDAVGKNYCMATDVGFNEGGGEYSVGRWLVLDGLDELSMFFPLSLLVRITSRR